MILQQIFFDTFFSSIFFDSWSEKVTITIYFNTDSSNKACDFIHKQTKMIQDTRRYTNN